MTIIDGFEGFCQEEIIPALKEEAANGRWEGITPSSFHEDKGEDYYVIALNYAVRDLFTVQLGLWGQQEEDNTFVVNCKCVFVDDGQSDKNIEEEKDVFLTNCSMLFNYIGFGVEDRKEGICVWASLGEENGEYEVPNVDNPYALYCMFLSLIVDVIKRMDDEE